MADVQTPQRTRSFWPILLAAGGLLGGTAIVALFLWHTFARETPPPPVVTPASTADATAEVHRFCAACHLYPPPDSFPPGAMKRSAPVVHVSLAEALSKGPPPPGNLAAPIFSRGSLAVEFYTPAGNDPRLSLSIARPRHRVAVPSPPARSGHGLARREASPSAGHNAIAKNAALALR